MTPKLIHHINRTLDSKRKAGFSGMAILAMAILAVTPALSSAQTTQIPQPEPAQPDPGTVKKMKEVRTELEKVTQKLNQAQRAALTQPEVQEEQAEYDKTVQKKIVEKKPEIQPQLEEHQKLLQKLQTSEELKKSETERSPEFQARVRKYQELEQTIAPHREEVAQTGEVRQKLENLESVLIAAMTKIEPTTPKLIEKRTELASQYRQMQQQLQVR